MGWGTYNQFTPASEAIVLLANPELLPLLLCAGNPCEPGMNQTNWELAKWAKL